MKRATKCTFEHMIYCLSYARMIKIGSSDLYSTFAWIPWNMTLLIHHVAARFPAPWNIWLFTSIVLPHGFHGIFASSHPSRSCCWHSSHMEYLTLLYTNNGNVVFFDVLVSCHHHNNLYSMTTTTCPRDVSVGNKKAAHMMFALKETFWRVTLVPVWCMTAGTRTQYT